MALLDLRRRGRVINALRKMFPELEWWYEWPDWHNSAGWRVSPYSVLTPRHPSDDETSATIYVRSDKNEQVLL